MSATTKIPVYLRIGVGSEHEIGTLELDLADDTPPTGKTIAALLRSAAEQFEKEPA